MYLGIYTIFCVLCASSFAGRIPALLRNFKSKSITIYKRFHVAVVLSTFACSANICVLSVTASVGSNGLNAIRTFLRRTAEEKDEEIVKKVKYVNQHLSLRLQTGDVGLRMYGVLLDFKFLTQLFSLWGTFLTMVYSTAKRAQ